MKQLIPIVAIMLVGCGEPQAPQAPDVAASVPPSGTGYEQMWATTERVQRRTCASERCGIVGQLFFRESARVYERHDGWARITEPYSASCVNGLSEYVDRGAKTCTPENGITDGEFAEWAPLNQLSDERPPDPAETATLDEKLIAGSDDFGRHRTAFVTAAQKLLADGRCSISDFEEMGGWWKSSNHRDEPIYFTYCGGMTIQNRIYLEARSGRILQE